MNYSGLNVSGMCRGEVISLRIHSSDFKVLLPVELIRTKMLLQFFVVVVVFLVLIHRNTNIFDQHKTIPKGSSLF